MENKIVCAKCGAINDENAKFCNNCGSEIAIINMASTSSATRSKKSKKPIIIGIASVVAIFLIVLFAVIIPKSGNNAIKKKFKNLSIGDTVTFGKYEQDITYAQDGKEDIEWTVLDIQGDSYLLISKYGLDAKPFNFQQEEDSENPNYVTWETCSLREWLNNDFYNEAFTDNEKSYISKTYVEGQDNYVSGAVGGNDTHDKVFALSLLEVEQYLGNETARACKATDYAKQQGVRVAQNGTCNWWLRTPGRNQGRAVDIEKYDLMEGQILINAGEINYQGTAVLKRTYAVRPVMWVNVNGDTDVKQNLMPTQGDREYGIGDM